MLTGSELGPQDEMSLFGNGPDLSGPDVSGTMARKPHTCQAPQWLQGHKK